MFTISRRTRRELCSKELGQTYGQPKKVMARMKNYSTRPSEIPFLTSIPAKILWAVLRDYDTIHEVHPYVKVVPADRGIGSLGKFIETFKGEYLSIKEEGAARADDAGFQ